MSAVGMSASRDGIVYWRTTPGGGYQTITADEGRPVSPGLWRQHRGLAPWLDDGDVRLYHGDCLDVLRDLPDRSVHMVATSPPFYGLRDYGVEGQLGLEETPDAWVARLVAVFRECRRVLRDDGTLWVEIGDSYCANDAGKGLPNEGHVPNAWQHRDVDIRTKGRSPLTPMKHPTKQKDLLGQPWMLAFALRADGWYLRSEIIWHKPNPMPESVTDRPTKAHSTVFLLSKSARYFYDADAIREQFTDGNRGAGQGFRWGSPHYTEQKGALDNTLGGLPSEAPRGPDGRRVTAVKGGDNSEQHRDGARWPNPSGANARSVWTIATEPTPFAHFATWPQKLVARMIQAGTSEHGCCPECGAPWVRQTATALDAEGRTTNGRKPRTGERRGVRMVKTIETLGWAPSCDHGHDPVPATVLDPFAGSGTTCLVARNHGRHAIGIDLNEAYLEIAAGRLAQQSLLTGDIA